MLEKLVTRLLRRLARKTAKSRLTGLAARHLEISALLSLDDEPVRANDRLLDLAQTAIQAARGIDLEELARRNAPDLAFTWPGEHYRLLAALVEVLEPRTVIEIGTYQGLSALAMLERLPDGASLTTFDVEPWDGIEGTFLRPGDFADGRLAAITADLGRVEEAERHRGLLERADLVFLDAAKDGSLEQRILDHLATAGLRPGALVVLDDIRVWNMLHIWRSIQHPKLDLTSFGHWSGTGLVDWRATEAPRG